MSMENDPNTGLSPYWHGAIWLAFGLTRAAYLVVPRRTLQSMPADWQEKFVALMGEAHELLPADAFPEYSVQRKEGGKFVKDPLREYRHSGPIQTIATVKPPGDLRTKVGGRNRWPFVESPGEFASRLAAAMREFDLLGAVRNVLIESPAVISAEHVLVPDGFELVDLDEYAVLPLTPTEDMLDIGWPLGEIQNGGFDREGAYADLIATQLPTGGK